MAHSYRTRAWRARARAAERRLPTRPTSPAPVEGVLRDEPVTLVVALSEERRPHAIGLAPHDGAALEAGEALARGFSCDCEALHIPRSRAGAAAPDEAILCAVHDRPNPLLVLGARSRFPAAGRTTRGVVTCLPCPVWIQRGPWRVPQRVLVALSEIERDWGAFHVAIEVASMLGAEVDLVHCREHARREPNSLSRAELEYLANLARKRCAGSRAASGEVGVLEIAGPTPVALAPHLERAELTVLGRGPRRELGSVLNDVVAYRRGPFLIVPDGA